MKRTFNLILLVTLLALAFGAQGVTPAYAAVTNVAAYDQGWYDPSGSHNPDNSNYIIGLSSGGHRDFFVFNLASLNGTVTGATLHIFQDGFYSPDPSETIEFYDVTTSIPSLLAGSGGLSAWSDLGSGTMFGSVTVTSASYGTWVDIPLNANGLAAIQSALGGDFAIGGVMSTIGGGGEYSFGFSGYTFATLDVDFGIPTDTTPPVVTVPSDITAEATSASGAAVNFSVSATDETSPANPTVTCDWNDGDTFPLGTTPVTCSATDDASNTGYGYFNVTVKDTTAPQTFIDSGPASLTNSTSATLTFHSTDAVTDPANIVHSCGLDGAPWQPCTSPYTYNGLSEGYHWVWVMAVDQAGNDNYNTTTALWEWTVDLTAPSFGLVADNPYEATGPGGANAAYNAFFSDDNGIASQSCTPASGSLFPIGTTTVNCTGTDNAGNTSNPSFGIEVVDTTAPTLTLPADITVPQTIPAGAVVNFSVTASDIVDASPSVSCTPASGSTFPVGTTTVNCSATDDYSNTSNGSFTVTVTAATGGNLLKKPDFASASVFPTPWQAFGFKPPYAAALDCNFFNFGSCSVVFPAGNRSAMQRIVRSGVAGDTYSFGMYSAAQNVPAGGKYLVEVAFYNNYNRLVGISQLNFSLGTHGFELVSGPATATGNYNKITFRFYYQNSSGRAWFDDAFLYFVGAP